MSDPKDQNKPAGKRDELDAALDALFSEDADAGAPAPDPLAAFEDGDDPFADLAADMKHQASPSPEAALDADAGFDATAALGAEPAFDADAAFDAEFDDAPAPRFGTLPEGETDPFADLDGEIAEAPVAAPVSAPAPAETAAASAIEEQDPFAALAADEVPETAEHAANLADTGFGEEIPSHDADGMFPLDDAPLEGAPVGEAGIGEAPAEDVFPMDDEFSAELGDEAASASAMDAPDPMFGEDPFAEADPTLAPLTQTDESEDPFGGAVVEWNEQDSAALEAVSGEIEEVAELQAIDALEDAPSDAYGEEMAEESYEDGEPRPGEVRKFLFEYDFGAPPPAPPAPVEPEPEIFEVEAEMVIEPEPEPEPPPPPPPPSFTEEEMAAARAVAYAEGEAAGLLSATQAHEARLTRAAETISEQLPALLGERTALLNSIATEAARLAHAMVRKLVPELDRRYGVYEIESVIQSSIQKALDQPRIIVRLHGELAQPMRERIENIALIGGFAGRVTILTDDTLGPADVRIDWGDGGSERLSGRVWEEITAIVGRVVENLEETAPPAVLGTNRPVETAA